MFIQYASFVFIFRGHIYFNLFKSYSKDYDHLTYAVDDRTKSLKLSQLDSSPSSYNVKFLRLANNFESSQIQSTKLFTNSSG